MRIRQVSRRTTKVRKRTAEGTWTGASFMIAEPSEIRAGAWEARADEPPSPLLRRHEACGR
jgi:hypothetical protein